MARYHFLTPTFLLLYMKFSLCTSCQPFPETVSATPMSCTSSTEVRDALQGEELGRAINVGKALCVYNCSVSADCLYAVRATISGQKTCVYISGLVTSRSTSSRDYMRSPDCEMYTLSGYHVGQCPSNKTGRHCETDIPFHCDTIWVETTPTTEQSDYSSMETTLLQFKIRTVANDEDGANATVIYDVTMAASDGTSFVRSTSHYYFSFNYTSRSFPDPPMKEVRYALGQSTNHETTFVKVQLDGTQELIGPVQLSPFTSLRQAKVSNNRVKGGADLVTALQSGHARLSRDYTHVHFVEAAPQAFLQVIFLATEPEPGTQPAQFLSFRRSTGNGVAYILHQDISGSSSTVSSGSSQSSWEFDDCWYPGASNTLDVLKYVRLTILDTGSPVRVVIDNQEAADVLMTVMTSQNVLTIMAPYLEQPAVNGNFAVPPIIVYSSISGRGVSSKLRLSHEQSTFHELLGPSSGHKVEWFLSSRVWELVYSVQPGNNVLYGQETPLRQAALGGHNIQVCAVMRRSTWCFGTKYVTVLDDGEVTLQSPTVPFFEITTPDGNDLFKDTPDLVVVYATSRGQCLVLKYKNGEVNGMNSNCPGVTRIKWYVEN